MPWALRVTIILVHNSSRYKKLICAHVSAIHLHLKYFIFDIHVVFAHLSSEKVLVKEDVPWGI